MMRIMSLHQPNLFPYLGIWEKFLCSDVWFWASDFQLKWNEYQRRMKMTSPGSSCMVSLCIGCEFKFTPMNQVLVQTSDELLNKIPAWYPKNPWSNAICNIVRQMEYGITLSKYNMKIIRWLLDSRELFGKNRPLELLTENFQREPLTTASDYLAELCTRVHCNTYLAGGLGKNYIDEDAFTKRGVRVIYQDFEPFEYKQEYSEKFEPGCSLADTLLNSVDLQPFIERSLEVKRRLHNNG